jgi:hypothetical protein
VILATLASLAILAVTAAPGRVFEWQAEQRAPRHNFRSSFAEYVELVMVGAATTLLAVLIVAFVAGVPLHILDLSRLLNEPKEYVKDEPHAVVGYFLVAVLLSYAIAFSGGRWLRPKAKVGDGAYRGHTIWFDYFDEDRPGDKAVSVSVELTNGIQLSGILDGFTPTDADDRELSLMPATLRRPGGEPVKLPDNQFVILRESQVAYLVGEYSKLLEDDGSDRADR